ncbi:hypothetical protein FRX31_003034, partial [Thalictrum thalictroides]
MASDAEEAKVCDQEEREQLERNMRERDTIATRKLVVQGVFHLKNGANSLVAVKVVFTSKLQ